MSEEPPDKRRSVGYRSPPASRRFRKGESGNPKGRPPGPCKAAPYEAALGQMVTIRENGVERQVKADEAFVRHIAKLALEGNSAAAREALAASEAARARRPDQSTQPGVIVFRDPGDLSLALEPLRMATKLDRYRVTAKVALEPWLVEAALERLGDRRLTREEQEKVVGATRTPAKIKWPDWWEVHHSSGS